MLYSFGILLSLLPHRKRIRDEGIIKLVSSCLRSVSSTGEVGKARSLTASQQSYQTIE